MRAARLIKMVLLLQSRPSMTAAELARELEVSERTVTRDAQALSEAGVPVYAERGRAGGYRLIGGYRTRLTGLARGEAEALFLSGVPGALREMGLEDAASAARLKVSAALLPSLRDASRTAAQRFHLDAPTWFREPRTPELLPAIADAVWDDRRVTARYRRGEEEVVRDLEPYGLVLKAGVWYLCARVAGSGPGAGGGPGPAEDAGGRSYRENSASHGEAVGPGRDTGARPGPGGGVAGGPGTGSGGEAVRGPGVGPGGERGGEAGRDTGPGPGGSAAPSSGTGPRGAAARGLGAGPGDGAFRVYRIERFTGVAARGERFGRDEGFDLPGFWAERAGEFARAILRDRVVVRLSAAGARRLPHAVDPPAAREALDAAGAPDAAGWVTVTLPVESEEVAHEQLRVLGPEAEVLAPESLRERFARDARRLAELYAGAGPGGA